MFCTHHTDRSEEVASVSNGVVDLEICDRETATDAGGGPKSLQRFSLVAWNLLFGLTQPKRRRTAPRAR